MRHLSKCSVAPLCGLVLGLLVLFSAGSMTVMDSSAATGGGTPWYPVYAGAWCDADVTTTSLACPDGRTYGYEECVGGSFYGTMTGTTGRVVFYQPYHSAGCTSTAGQGQTQNCPMVYWSYCQRQT